MSGLAFRSRSRAEAARGLVSGASVDLDRLYAAFAYIVVFNRIDHPDHAERLAWIRSHHPGAVFASCETPSLTLYGFADGHVRDALRMAFSDQSPHDSHG